MRFVPTFCIREGMKLGRTLYGRHGEVLRHSGTELKQIYIERIIGLGYNGIYIDDEISQDIEIQNIISDDLRNQTIKGVKNVFINTERKMYQKDAEQELALPLELVEKIIDEILDNKNMMINMIDLKVFDEYTFYHSVNVAVLSIVVGATLNLNRLELYKLGMAALLHDIGKVFVPKSILEKNGKLTDEEFAQMKKHSELGYSYLKDKYNIPVHSYVGVLQHHERYDGKGYPYGKKGEDISLFGRIISVADVYDALTSDRPYRKAMLPSEAMEYIMGNSGTMFDPQIVKIFLKKVAAYPVGTVVRLSNGWSGLVIENHEHWATRLTVKIIKKNEENVEPFILEMHKDYNCMNITIVGIEKM